MPSRSPADLLLAVSSILVVAVAQTESQWSTSPFNPPAVPLAVKTPYLNSWLAQGGSPPAANEAWADFWNNVGHIAGTSSGDTQLYAGVNVDGVPYRVMGNAEVPNVRTAQQVALDITATRTSFLFEAGPMEINATFLSPIDPSDLAVMSMPITYFYMTASSTDGKSHSVAMYSDVSSQWISSSVSEGTQVGAVNTTNGMHLVSAMLSAERYSEVNQQSPNVMLFYSTQLVDGLTWEIGIDADVRSAFAINSSLATGTTGLAAPGSIEPLLIEQSGSLPVLGLSVELGSIKRTANPVVWQIAVIESTDINFAGKDGIQQRFPFFLSQSRSIPITRSNITGAFEDASDPSFLETALDNFNTILDKSIAIDNAIHADGLSVSSEYADILVLSLRQVMASMEITISVGSDGQWNTSDVMSFMKNMGGLGSSTGINCVDILYSAFPVFQYMNSSFGRYLLAPVLDFADRPTYPLLYAPQDIGTTYPNATGNTNAHLYGIEETSNMIIMTYTDILASGDGSLAMQHYGLLKSWGSYLLNNSLIPGDQLAPESSTGNVANMTNLALKGILGMGAMAKISDFLGFSADGADFMSNAQALMTKWQTMAVLDGQVLLSYNDQNSTGLLYNLYVDKTLQLNMVSSTVYAAQSVYYGQQTANAQYGVATMSGKPTTRADWTMLSAASLIEESPGVRDSMILQVHNYLSANTSSMVFPVQYDITTGNPILAVNSPSVGAMFAVLAAAGTTIHPSASTIAAAAISSSHIKRWLIIFISTFSPALALLLVFLAFYFVRRRNQRLARRRRQTFVRLHNLPRSAATPRASQVHQLSPLPDFNGDFKAPVDVGDVENWSDAYARKGYFEQQRAVELEENPPTYEGPNGILDTVVVKVVAAES